MATGPNQIAGQQLVPVKALFCGPAKTGTADCDDGCFCPDNTAYMIKKIKADNPHSPHNEWFGSNVAYRAGVPTAGFNVVEHTDGNLWFGSQFRVGEIKDWWLRVLDGTIQIDAIRDDLSKIYGFDLFMNNIDRHNGNFLVVPEGQTHRALAIDHGRSWLFSGFPPVVIDVTVKHNTRNWYEWMKGNFAGYPNPDAVKESLSNIKAIATNDVKIILNTQPNDWLNQNDTDGIVAWWDSGDAFARVDTLIGGIDDGSLL